MNWKSIVIVFIILSYLVYGMKNMLLIRKINISLETDDNKQEKIVKLRRKVMLWFIFSAFLIIILFLLELLGDNAPK